MPALPRRFVHAAKEFPRDIPTSKAKILQIHRKTNKQSDSGVLDKMEDLTSNTLRKKDKIESSF